MPSDSLPVFAGDPPPEGRAHPRFLTLTRAALSSHLRICSGPGTMKSRFLSRVLLWQCLLLNIPFIVFDVTGSITANLIDKICRCPEKVQGKLWERLHYSNRGAPDGIDDYVATTPCYVPRRPHETLFEIANRLPEVFLRLDPELGHAAVMGKNALLQCSRYAGEIAAALHLQLPEAADLVRHPQRWKEPLRRVLDSHPELGEAVAYFRQFMDPTARHHWYQQTSSFLVKLQPFEEDAILRATFGASQSTVDYPALLEKGKGIIVDYSDEKDRARAHFKLVWDFTEMASVVVERGLAGHDALFPFVIDELVALLGPRTEQGSVLAHDLEQLASVWARNAGCQLVISHQNLSQLEPRVQHVLEQMGTQIIGNVPSFADALALAQALHQYDPTWVIKEVPVWMSVQHYAHHFTFNVPQIVSYNPVEATPEQQFLILSNTIRRLPRGQFLVRPALGEGQLTGTLRRMDLARLDAGMYPDAELVTEAKRRLRRRDGVPIRTVLRQIEQRRQEVMAVKPTAAKQSNASGILEKGERVRHAHPPSSLPAQQRRQHRRRRDTPAPAAPVAAVPPVESEPFQAQYFSDPPGQAPGPDAA